MRLSLKSQPDLYINFKINYFLNYNYLFWGTDSFQPVDTLNIWLLFPPHRAYIIAECFEPINSMHLWYNILKCIQNYWLFRPREKLKRFQTDDQELIPNPDLFNWLSYSLPYTWYQIQLYINYTSNILS